MSFNSQGRRTKYIFVTGGVVSSIGKGIAAASIGALLEARGLKIAMTKMDPYINVDPGTMSPTQHGEVFVTDDGAETDLDLGHYQRFTGVKLTKKNSFTTGQIYERVIGKERQGAYLGGTVQVIPHVTDQIKENIIEASQDADISIIEVGGTVGDIESLPFLEAIRQFKISEGRDNVIFVHVTYIPYIKAAGELKTKPTQHSVKTLNSLGIQPEILICRAEQSVPTEMKRKISHFCSVEQDAVFESLDAETIYEMPEIFHKQGLDTKIINLLGVWTGQPNLTPWQEIVNTLKNPEKEVRIAVVGKYHENQDSYKSIDEALIHAGISNKAKVKLVEVDSEHLSATTTKETFANIDGIIIPGGFGNRGIVGKLVATRYARENNIPFLGICLGLQIACIEYARNVLNLHEATSEEFDPNSDYKIIHIMASQKKITNKGGSMRLGAYDCIIKKNTKAHKAYASDRISERHRHRFEFNSKFREQFETNGLIVSGESPDGSLVEMIELENHPWFVACQFHPELKSQLMNPPPLFIELISAAISYKENIR